MEEIEQLHTYKLSKKINKKSKNRFRINNKTILIIIIGSVAIITYLSLVLLIVENRQLNKKLKLSKINYISERSITINYFNQNYSAKHLFDGRDYIDENISQNLIHISYSLDNKLVYPTMVSMLSGLENCNQENFIIYHLLLSYLLLSNNISQSLKYLIHLLQIL